MKRIFTIIFLGAACTAYSQDFSKNIASAKSAYASGNLEEARFAMQQMINDLDVAIGKEVLKLLPTKLANDAYNSQADNVTGNTGIAGVIIRREYGTGEQIRSIDIMSNSPIVASLNAILALPFMANSSDGTQKVIKVEGYKGILQKTVDTETSKTDFTLQIPMNSTLLTLNVSNSTEAEVVKMANTIPVQQIAKMVQ